MRAPRYGLARILSKRGLCSRSEAERWIRSGRVRVDGQRVVDPEFPTALDATGIEVDAPGDGDGDAVAVAAAAPRPHRYLVLNKPRGLVTTARDERGRDTVYRCFDDAGLGWIAPVGRLDKASEGLLLFSSDAAWAARVASPSGPAKTYHVQVDTLPSPEQLLAMVAGVEAEDGPLRAAAATLLRQGTRNAWLEIVLDEGRNRQVRRLMAAFDIAVLRLVRVAIGELALDTLAKGAWRALTPAEIAGLAAPSPGPATSRMS